MSIHILDGFAEFPTGLEELLRCHFFEKGQASGPANQAAGMVMKPLTAQARFYPAILTDLNVLCKFRERAVVFMAWERCLLLAGE